jgi:hypothetical protein
LIPDQEEQLYKKKKKTKLKIKRSLAQELDSEDYLHIIHELDRDQDTCDEQSMHIERIERKTGLSLRKPIKIHISNNKTRGATI